MEIWEHLKTQENPKSPEKTLLLNLIRTHFQCACYVDQERRQKIMFSQNGFSSLRITADVLLTHRWYAATPVQEYININRNLLLSDTNIFTRVK